MPTDKLHVYKCEICGNMVEVVHASGGTLVCCGQPMALMAENTTDAAVEKHVPVVEAKDGGLSVVVGSIVHPMTEAHLIEWIELIADGKAYLQFLNPGDSPEAFFAIAPKEYTVRAYCNLHGLWKAE
ncbi:MAG: desulfoferrodoxin [Proteobacteria bacterium]|jgi:superoxide reductase|nr:desulfoferrodoxin [Pseudomonadota bacterium]